MYEIFLLLLFIIPCSIKAYPSVPIDSNFISLPTTSYYNYFYTYSSSLIYDTVYFHLQTESYKLNYVDYCIRRYQPTASEIRDCSFRSLSRYYYKYSGNNEDGYYKAYLDNYKIAQYVIVRYSGSNSYGRLYAKSAYRDLSSKLSTVAIVFIAIGSAVVAVIIIGLICYACKRRADAENINYEAQPAVAIAPTPIMSPNSVYTTY